MSPNGSVLITISHRDIIGRDVVPWLVSMDIRHQVRGDEIDILELPISMELTGFDDWPSIKSTRHWLEGDPKNGRDFIADIDPDTGELNIRDRWWDFE